MVSPRNWAIHRMPNRIWVMFLTVGSIATAVVLFWGLLQVWGYQREHSDQRQNVSNYEAPTSDDYSSGCLKDGVTFRRIAECLIKSVDANREAQRSNYDLKAQQEMAEWAFAIVLLTGAQAVFGLFGIVLLVQNLSTAREAIHADNRPWLDFSVEVASNLDHNDTDFYEKGLGVDIIVTAKNYGGSPAMGVRLKIGEILPKGTDELLDFPFFAGRRDAMRREYSSSQIGSVTIFPSMDAQIGGRILISESALKRAPKRASLDPDVKEKSIIFQYIISVFYTSPTTTDALETSSAFMFFMSAWRGTERQIAIGYDDKFRPIPKRKIRLRETGHKRTI